MTDNIIFTNNIQTMTDTEVLATYRKKSADRQKIFYDKNRDTVNAKRRAAYALKHGIALNHELIHEEMDVHHNDDVFEHQTEHIVQPAPEVEQSNLRRSSRVKTTTVIPLAIQPTRKLKKNQNLPSNDELLELLINDESVSKGTKKSYIGHFETLCRIIKKAKFTSLLNKPEKITNAIDSSSYATNSKKCYIQICLFFIDKYGLTNIITPENKAELNLYFDSLKIKGHDEHKTIVETTNVMKYTDYLKLVEETFGKLSKEYIITQLYYAVPMRDDFRLALIKNASEATDMDENYMVLGNRIEVIFNSYKTDKSNGIKTFLLTLGLSNEIRKYINEHNIKDFLFGKSKSLSGVIKKINTTVGVEGSINTLRKMKSSEANNGEFNELERAQVARDMGHSALTQAKYVRKIKS